MWFSSIEGIMARRLLVNWRVPVAAARRMLPAGVRPKVVKGWAIAGVCLVRLEQMRPTGMPAWIGVASENAAARIGVEWDEAAGRKQAVFIFRRDTASAVNRAFGARIGFGEHARGRFGVADDGQRVRIELESADGWQRVEVALEEGEGRGSVLATMGEAERFFRSGECGYSPARREGVWDGVRLKLHRWDLRAMRVARARSSFIEECFPGAEVDSAFIMRDIPHTWTHCGRVRFGEAGVENVGVELAPLPVVR